MSFNLYLLYTLNSMNCVDGLQTFGYTLKKKSPNTRKQASKQTLID